MKMHYCVVGTNDMAAATEFYNKLFEGTGFEHVVTKDRMVFWQNEGVTFALAKPFDGQAATNGNGTMFGFDVGTVEAVKNLYEKTLALGGTCEGKPDERGPCFSAYVRDLDKNKICFSAFVA